MKSRYYDCMTKDMQDCADIFTEDYMKAEFLYCHEQYKKAKAAEDTKLPATSVNGTPVLHGARCEMGAIAHYWAVRRDLIKAWLPDEWVRAQGANTMIYER